ncbi:MAG: helix-turn-helix domain-containing protein [Candidatus Uhrbacteria bacterium]|nr:helix-turn-helix domain-containing protein [Candidatus Uhrbacteria bacterium]
MSKNYTKLLIDVGFLPSEVKVYMASLELGPSTVQNVAKKANISRTAGYEAIEALQKRGLISSSTRGKRKLFAAESPERIVTYLREEQQKFQSTLQDITSSVEAMKLMAGGIKPSVRAYEGEEALHAYFDHIATVKPQSFDELSNLDDVYEYLDDEKVKSARKAYSWAKHTKIRLLHRGKLRNPRAGAQFRELGHQWGDFHGNISIYDNFVTFVTYIGITSVVIIESETLANTMKMMFDIAWSQSKESKISLIQE